MSLADKNPRDHSPHGRDVRGGIHGAVFVSSLAGLLYPQNGVWRGGRFHHRPRNQPSFRGIAGVKPCPKLAGNRAGGRLFWRNWAGVLGS